MGGVTDRAVGGELSSISLIRARYSRQRSCQLPALEIFSEMAYLQCAQWSAVLHVRGQEVHAPGVVVVRAWRQKVCDLCGFANGKSYE